MNINRPLMPGFLKRAEQKLLLNKPLIWSTRVHLVLYYGILYNLFLTGLSFLAPMDILGRSITEYWVGFQVIIAIIALTVWLIYLLRFNVFKKYGNIKPLHALVTFLLYFISTGIIILSVFIYPIVECVRANMVVGDAALVQDINNMNIQLNQLEYKVLNKKWEYDTVAVDRNMRISGTYLQPAANDDDAETADVERAYNHDFYTMDTATFNNRLSYTDSLIKLNDTLYLLYKTPDLEFVSSFSIDDFTSEKILHSFEIYNKVLKHPPAAAEMPAIARAFNQLEKKYNKFDLYMEEIELHDAPEEIIRKKHHLNSLNNHIGNLISKKYNFSRRHLSEMIRVFYYFTLGITLLIFIFRYTTVRTFFLSLLSGVLLVIFTAMMLSFSRAGSSSFLGWMIGYTLLFFVGSIFTFSSTKRNVLNGILINLFVFIVPVFPLLVVDLIYELKKEQNYQKYGTYSGPYAEQYFLYAEIGGTVLLLVLLATYINKLYRRWYSLPEH